MRIALFALLLAGCTTAEPLSPSDPASGDRFVQGRVTAVDLDPMAYDGNGQITLVTDGGEAVLVQIPARTNLCEADLRAYGDVQVGDRLSVRGAPGGGGIVPCASEAHYLRRN